LGAFFSPVIAEKVTIKLLYFAIAVMSVLNIFIRDYLRIVGLSIMLLAYVQSDARAAGPVARSDILLHIVTQCADPTIQDYCNQCMSPRLEGHCGVSECKKTTEVWAMNDQYLAMRDIKMCGCPASFVHGLALPRSVITGVEDPKKPEEIWQFAWDQAMKKMEPESIALVVNPRGFRSQNQLHIHLLRLSSKAREKLSQNAPIILENLDRVWSSARQSATSKGLNDYGVIVVQTKDQKFMVVTTEYSPEGAFTQWRCD
jgi:CDP-diacylglycerol pyrophosphatase